MIRHLLQRFRVGKTPELQMEAPATEEAVDRAAAKQSPLPELFVGRQPIVNNQREIVAYQLLFRGDLMTNAADINDSVAATGDVLLNTLNNIGLEKVLGEAVAFVKIPVEMLEHPVLSILPQRKIVLDLPGDLKVDEGLIERVVTLKKMGYRFAMTNFRFDISDTSILKQLDFAKLSAGQLSDDELRREVRNLRGRGLRLIAEKIEDQADFQAARALLMNYYQGYFFAKPEILHMRRVDPQSTRVARLFNLVLSDAPRDVIETEFKQDVALSFNLLRYINSPGMGLMEEVSSIKHALIMMGKTRLSRWLSMMMIRSGKQSVAPKALLRTALIRARATETMGAGQLGASKRDHLFMTGMFSMLDVLFGMQLEEAVGTLNLPEPIKQALVDGDGPYYPYLALATACDHFDVEGIRTWSRRLGIPLRQINQMQTEAMVWARQMDEGALTDED